MFKTILKSIRMFGMLGFCILASEAIQDHYDPLVYLYLLGEKC